MVKNNNYKKIIIIVLLVLSSVSITSANPGIVVNVQPGSLDANVGQTIVYEVRTDSISDVTEHVALSITNPVAGWVYTFDTPEFDLVAGSSFTTNLLVSIPESTSPGSYSSDVLGTASVPDFEDFVTGTSFFTFITNVSIPEFPTMALPIVSVLGILLVLRKKEQKKKLIK